MFVFCVVLQVFVFHKLCQYLSLRQLLPFHGEVKDKEFVAKTAFVNSVHPSSLSSTKQFLISSLILICKPVQNGFYIKDVKGAKK